MLSQGGSAEVELLKDQTFKLSTDKAYMEKGNANLVYVDYENISKVLKVGSRVYVDDGLISLIVTAVSTYRFSTYILLSSSMFKKYTILVVFN